MQILSHKVSLALSMPGFVGSDRQVEQSGYTVCGKKTLPLPFNETERNGPFTIRSSSVRGPCVFAVRFESVLIKYYYIRIVLSALARGSL